MRARLFGCVDVSSCKLHVTIVVDSHFRHKEAREAWPDSVISYLRKGKSQSLVCVHNFTPETHADYLIKLPGAQNVVEVFNTDAALYGGSNQLNTKVSLCSEGFRIGLAPLATMIFQIRH